ncbi:hypothetical protein ACIP5L_23945 [Streptomyces bacillaris]
MSDLTYRAPGAGGTVVEEAAACRLLYRGMAREAAARRLPYRVTAGEATR